MTLTESIEFLLSLGLPPIKVHGVMLDACTCGRADCPSPGKHPIGNGWQKNPIIELDVAMAAFAKHKGNIGACVAGTPFVCLDFDGPEGAATLKSLTLPDTLTARSGSGGTHKVFKLTTGQVARDINDRRALPGLDIKKHGQFIVEPSENLNGKYAWTDRSPIADLPNDIYQKIRKPSSTKASRAEAYIRKMPPAISGAQGHTACFAVARKLVQDFGLNELDTMALLRIYNERCEPPWTEDELAHKYSDAVKARVSNPISAPVTTEDWRSQLLWSESKNGAPKLVTCQANVIRILQLDPQWNRSLSYDELRGRIVVTEPPWKKHGLPEAEDDQWGDQDGTRLSAWMRHEYHQYGFSPTVVDCDSAVDVAARDRKFHPVRSYLGKLAWDGRDHIPDLCEILRTEKSTYNCKVLKWWLIAAVARAFEPGCRAQTALILEGKQGIGKSTAIQILAGQWGSDTSLDLNSKDAFQQIRGKWIIELAELDSMTRVSSERAKQFISSPRDDYRPAYGRREILQPRQCVFVGSTNGDTYLHDTTGNRRYHPVRCGGTIHTERLRSIRDQLWAQATHLFAANEPHYPQTPEDVRMIEEEQDERLERDPWETAIRDYLIRTAASEVSCNQVLGLCLHIEAKDWSRAHQMRAGGVLRGMGWLRARRRDGLHREYVYVRPPDADP